MSHKAYRPAERPSAPASKPVRTPSKQDVDVLRQQITDLIGQKPEKAATILTEWLRQADLSVSKTAKKPTKKAG